MGIGYHPCGSVNKIIGTIFLITMLISIPFFSPTVNSQDPTVEDDYQGTRTVRWDFQDPTDYLAQNVSVGGMAELDLEDESDVDTDFFNGTLDGNTTIKNGNVTLMGNEANLVNSGDFSSLGDWNFTDSSDGNITAKGSNNYGEFMHESNHTQKFKQLDAMDAQNLSRWWWVGSQVPTIFNDQSDNIEGNSALSAYWSTVPGAWIRIYRDDEGTWDWSRFTNISIQARDPAIGAADMFIYLYNKTDYWTSPEEMISMTWLHHWFNLGSAFNGNLSEIDRFGINLANLTGFAGTRILIDNISAFWQFNNMDSISGWLQDGSIPLPPLSISSNRLEGSGSINLTWNPGSSSDYARIIKQGLFDWSAYTHLNISVDTNYSGSGLNMSIILRKGALKWNSFTNITSPWNKYHFNISNAFSGDLSNIDTIEINFTGVNIDTSVFIDDIQLYKQFDSMDFAWTPSPWQPDGEAPPGLAYNSSAKVEGNSSLKIWWNPLGNSTKRSILYNDTIIDNDWSVYNRLMLWANTTYGGPNLNMSLSIYNGSSKWDSAPFELRNDWTEYVFDLSGVQTSLLTSVTRIDINFTGIDMPTTVYIDDIRLDYYKTFNQTAYINQTFTKTDFTPTTPTNVFLKFDYTVLNFTNNPDASNIISVWINDTANKKEVWNLNPTSNVPWTTKYIDISDNLSSTGDYTISIRYHLTADTPLELGFDVAFDNISIRAPGYENGIFTSKICDVNNIAIWKNITWIEETDPDTNITVQVRFGNTTDEVNASTWSLPPFTNSGWESIQMTVSSMIQYRLNLTTTNASKAPIFSEMNISYQKYHNNGYVVTQDFIPDLVNITSWGNFSANITIPPNTSLEYWMSSNWGTSWSLVSSQNLSAAPLQRIRFRVNLTTNDTSRTPFLHELQLEYKYNMPPVITNTIDNIEMLEEGSWVLDLTNFSSDESGDVKWFVTGENNDRYTVTGENNTVTRTLIFETKLNAFGNNYVTIWLEDSMGLKSYQNIWINITPINDPPSFQPPLNEEFEVDKDYVIDYSQYISDVDNTLDELTLVTDSDYASVNGFNVTYRFPTHMQNDQTSVYLTVSDELNSTSATIDITLKPQIHIGSNWDIIMPLGLGILGLLAVLFTMFVAIPAIRKRRQRFAIDDMFLVHRDGRLIAHYTRQLRADRDEDILSGMLTAVQEFVKDSMGRDEELKGFVFQEKNVLLERGEHVYLAVFITGEEPQDSREQVTAFIEDVEEAYSDILPQWTGEIESFRGLQDLMDRLFSVGGYHRMYWKKLKYLDANKKDRISKDNEEENEPSA